jgi:hypothetical protein
LKKENKNKLPSEYGSLYHFYPANVNGNEVAVAVALRSPVRDRRAFPTAELHGRNSAAGLRATYGLVAPMTAVHGPFISAKDNFRIAKESWIENPSWLPAKLLSRP